jgi:hypothetical protein
MARPMFAKPGPSVQVVLGTGCKIDGAWRAPGDVVSMTQAEADDLKAMRMARDLTADDTARPGYIRRDMQAR